MKLVTKERLSVLLFVLIPVVYTVVLYTFFLQWYRLVTLGIMSLAAGYYLVRLFFRGFKWYASFMLDEPMEGFNKKVEKPRLFFYSLAMPVLIVVFFSYLESNSANV